MVLRYLWILMFAGVFLGGASQSLSIEPSLVDEREVIQVTIETDEGNVLFVGNEGMFSQDGANATKAFGKTLLPSTLWHRQRRLKCYEHAIRVSVQLASVSNDNAVMERLHIISDGVELADATTALRFLDANYIGATHAPELFRNKISHLLQKIDARSAGGIRHETTNLGHLHNYLEWTGVAMDMTELSYSVLLREALATDAALERISVIEGALLRAQDQGVAFDPLWFDAVDRARANMTRDRTYFGALARKLEDEWVRMGVDFTVKRVLPHLIDKFHLGIKAGVKTWLQTHAGWSAQHAAVHASHFAAFWTWSIAATYYTIDALLDQHERAQCTVAAATLDHLLHRGEPVEAERHEQFDQMILQNQITYFDTMAKVCSGLLTGFHDFVSMITGGQRHYAEARDYFEERRQEKLGKLLAMVPGDYEPQPGGRDAAIGFIIDSSGSMAENDPSDIRKQALEVVVDRLLGGSERVFLVDFDGDSEWLNPGAWSGWSRDELLAAIDRIDSSGGTRVAGGLERMESAMKSSGDIGDRAGVLLLSDGLDSSYQDATDWFVSAGVQVHTISLVGEANEALLERIALQTGGHYMKASSAGDIINAFARFYDELSGRVAYVVDTGRISQGETVNIPFLVDSSDSPMDGICSWKGSTVELKLRSPSGTVYSDASGNGDWRVGANYASVTVARPESGQWTAELFGSVIRSGGEPFTFEVHADTDLRYELLSTGGDAGFLAFDLTTLDENLVASADVQVAVVTPDGVLNDITNMGDGRHISYVPIQGRGSYRFLVDVEGRRVDGVRFHRHVRRDAFVGEYVPLHIAPIGEPLGMYVFAPIGSRVGNVAGLVCRLYRGSPGQRADLVAQGYVTSCKPDACTAIMEQFFVQPELREGDLLMLDEQQWRGD